MAAPDPIERLEKIANLAKVILGGGMSLLVAVFSLGVAYARLQSDVADLSRQVAEIKADRERRIAKYEQDNLDTQKRLSSIEASLTFIVNSIRAGRQP